MTADTLPLPVLPQAGDFGLLPTYGNWRDRLAAWAIRWGTDAPVNHAFIYLGAGQVVEAAPGGARRTPLADFDQDSIVWSTGRLVLDPDERAAVCSVARFIAERSIGYGWADIVAITLAQDRLGNRVDRTAPLEQQPWWVRRIQSMDTLICSQLVDVCWHAAGRDLFTDGRLPGLVSPGDLWRRLDRL